MYQRGEGTSVDHQPGDERSKLLWRENIDFEHAQGMGTDWSVKDHIGTQFRNCSVMGVSTQTMSVCRSRGRTLSPYPLPQLRCEGSLLLVALEEVNVDVETAAGAVCYGRGEGGVC